MDGLVIALFAPVFIAAFIDFIVRVAFFTVLTVFAGLTIWGRSKVYRMMGAPGWHAVVPILSDITAFRLFASRKWLVVFFVGNITALMTFCLAEILVQPSISLGLGVPFYCDALFALTVLFAVLPFASILKRGWTISKVFGGGMGLFALLVLIPPAGNLYIGFTKQPKTKEADLRDNP